MTEADKIVRAADVNARVARAMIAALGMHADNMQRQHLGNDVAYDAGAFIGLIHEQGIDPNQITSYLFE